jgi:hypothetical protein
MLTAEQYRAKAAEYTELLKAASLPAESHEFRRLERSYLVLAENEEWMADNRNKINIMGADENWYSGTTNRRRKCRGRKTKLRDASNIALLSHIP